MRGQSNNPEKYQVTRNLGHNSGRCNGGILIVRHRITGMIHLEKKFTRHSIDDGMAEAEIQLLRMLKPCEFITRLLDHCYKPHLPAASIWLAYYEQGSLEQLIKRHRGNSFICEEFAWKVFTQVADALRYCHFGPGDIPWEPIIHRDLKPANILLTMCHGGDVDLPSIRVGDFGCAIGARMGARPNAESYITQGDSDYWPPEAPFYYVASDIFQLGLIIVTMCRLELPDDLVPLTRGERSFSDQQYTQLLQSAVRKCMREDPQDRPGSLKLPDKLHEAYERVESVLIPGALALM